MPDNRFDCDLFRLIQEGYDSHVDTTSATVNVGQWKPQMMKMIKSTTLLQYNWAEKVTVDLIK